MQLLVNSGEKMKNKLAIFDLDGTLFDTKDVNYYAYKDAMSSLNYNLDYGYFVSIVMEDITWIFFLILVRRT